MDEITLTIDGSEVRGKRGDTILAVCERNGVDVPTLCHFQGLQDIGACRLCVVEIEGARALNTACTTPASNGMVIKTETPQLSALRKATLELLFAERNHFCMFCESSGQCELQALGYRYGIDAVRYKYMFPKLSVDSTNPNFVVDHNRCVLCRRCVRACAEVAGVSAVGYKHRGAETTISFDLDAPVGESTCVSCGACVQACPTGALIDRRGAYRGREGEVERISTSCQGCSVGCQMVGVVRGRYVLRLEGDATAEPSHGLLCAKGRYEALANGARPRVLKPLVRREGKLEEASWDEALAAAAAGIKQARAEHGAKSVTAVATAGATSEALYLLDWVFRGGLGARFAVAGAEDEATRSAAARRVGGNAGKADGVYTALEQADLILLLGADPGQSHPVLASIIRRRIAKRAARLVVAGDENHSLASQAERHLVPREGSEGVLINGLMHALLRDRRPKSAVDPEFAMSLGSYAPSIVQAACGIQAEDLLLVAQMLADARHPVIAYGGPMLARGGVATSTLSLVAVADAIVHGQVTALPLATGTNAAAAARLGAASPQGMEDTRAVFVSLGDAEVDGLAETLAEVPFLIVHAAYESALGQRADVVLPAPTWAEKEGTFLAGDGSKRRISPLVTLPAGVPDERALYAMLGARLGANAGFSESALAAKLEVALAPPAPETQAANPVAVDYL